MSRVRIGAARPPPAGMTQVDYLSPGKREQTKAANRLAILDAAREVFGDLGFEAATVRDIVRRSGLSVGAFYNYYRSKDEVFDALADDGARRFRPILEAQSAKASDFESYLRAAVGAYFDFIAAEQRNWLSEAPESEGFPRVRGTPEILAVFKEVRGVFATIMDRDLAAKVDIDYLAASCIAVAREIGDRMIERQSLDVRGATDFVVRLILGGLPNLPRLEP
jgi:AcrR family transcriptional regulator